MITKIKNIALKFIWLFLTFTIFSSSKESSEKIKTITYGVDFCSGKCDGYCKKQNKYNSKYLVKTEEYCKKDINKVKVDTLLMDDTKWKNICSYIDIEKFFKIDEISGGPGCSDGGIEWIEIVTTTRRRKIKFEYDYYFKEIGGLLVILRNRK